MGLTSAALIFNQSFSCQLPLTTTLYTYWPRVQNLLMVSQVRSASTSPASPTCPVASSALLTNQHIFIFPLLKISWNHLLTNDLSFQTFCHYMLIPFCVSLSPEISTGFQGVKGVDEWTGFESWISSPPAHVLECLDKRRAVFPLPQGQREDISRGGLWRTVVPSRMAAS